MMKVSVVLTTYNGEEYLYELLDSLRTQTYEIDEVLICDDCSNDNTQKIIIEYIDRFKLDRWKLIVNSQNKGWKKNFKDGILMTQGEFVFPCDQDDIWQPNKIERMVSLMKDNKNIMLLSSDYFPLYETGGQRVEEAIQSNVKMEHIPFNHHFALGNKPGCVMCINKQLITDIRSIWEDWYPHDAFLWTSAIFMDGCYVVHEPLIRYRRHMGNTTNHMTRDKEAVILSLKRNRNLADFQLSKFREHYSQYKIQILEQYQQYAKLRIDMLEKRKIDNFFRLIKYRKFYRSFKQELGDLYLIIR